MLDESKAIIDEEIYTLREYSLVCHLPSKRQRRRTRRRPARSLLHDVPRTTDQHDTRTNDRYHLTYLARILEGSLAENLQGHPSTQALQAHIVKKLIDLFWTILPEEDDRWLQATKTAHSIAEAVMHELTPPQVEEAEPLL